MAKNANVVLKNSKNAQISLKDCKKLKHFIKNCKKARKFYYKIAKTCKFHQKIAQKYKFRQKVAEKANELSFKNLGLFEPLSPPPPGLWLPVTFIETCHICPYSPTSCIHLYNISVICICIMSIMKVYLSYFKLKKLFFYRLLHFYNFSQFCNCETDPFVFFKKINMYS